MNFTNLENIKRWRHIENRDCQNGLLLNRNERVEKWNKDLIEKILKSINIYEWGKYTCMMSLYKKLANYLGINTNNLLITNGANGSFKEVLNFYRHKIKDDLHVGIQDQSYIMFDVYFKMFNNESIFFNSIFKALLIAQHIL